MNSINSENIHFLARKLGYKKDQQGIYARYLREKNHWETHLSNTKNKILEDILHLNPETVCVLGSGWLLDLPIDEFLKEKTNLILVDIHHPEIIRKKFLSEKIQFIEMDVTGIANQVHQQTRGLKFRPKLQLNQLNFNFNFIEQLPKADLYISLNILDQLDTLLYEYLTRKHVSTKDRLEDFRRQIQENHLKQLTENNFLIFYDLHELQYRQEKLIKKIKTSFVDSLIQPHNTWFWEFDTQGFYIRHMKIRYEVGYYKNF